MQKFLLNNFLLIFENSKFCFFFIQIKIKKKINNFRNWKNFGKLFKCIKLRLFSFFFLNSIFSIYLNLKKKCLKNKIEKFKGINFFFF